MALTLVLDDLHGESLPFGASSLVTTTAEQLFCAPLVSSKSGLEDELGLSKTGAKHTLQNKRMPKVTTCEKWH